LFAFYYLTIRFLSQMFGLRDHKLFSIIILPYLFIIAMVPSSIVDMYQKITQFGAWGMLITLVYPILLFFISLFRRKKGRKDNPSPL